MSIKFLLEIFGEHFKSLQLCDIQLKFKFKNKINCQKLFLQRFPNLFVLFFQLF